MFDVYGEAEQRFYNRITRTLINEFIRDDFVIYVLTSKRMDKTKKSHHLSALRSIRSNLKNLLSSSGCLWEWYLHYVLSLIHLFRISSHSLLEVSFSFLPLSKNKKLNTSDFSAFPFLDAFQLQTFIVQHYLIPSNQFWYEIEEAFIEEHSGGVWALTTKKGLWNEHVQGQINGDL